MPQRALQAAIEVLVRAQPLAEHAFAPYGDVICVPRAGGRAVNADTATRYDDIAALDVLADGGRPQLSIFASPARNLPFACNSLERHPLSTQAFLPLGIAPFLVIVADRGTDDPDASACAAFVTDGRQGVNLKRGVWHHPLVALAGDATFVVVGRSGSPNFVLRAFGGGGRVRVAR